MVVIINGFPQSGKSAFVAFCKLHAHAEHVYEYSTVDFVKSIATQCGWNGVKDAKNRKFLSDLKDLLTEWDDVPFKKSCREISLAYAESDYIGTTPDKMVVFIHCREPQEIQKFVDYYGTDNCRTLLIQRPSVMDNDQSNHADSQVLGYNYDDTIINDGTIEDLEAKAILYLRNLVGEQILR